VTARALAPLPKLLDYIHPLVQKGAKALLMKGQDIASELTRASKYWKIEAEHVPSKTDPTGRVLIVSGLARRR
jgi:16S rRNA (guanine527-N7)-methyltransferase